MLPRTAVPALLSAYRDRLKENGGSERLGVAILAYSTVFAVMPFKYCNPLESPSIYARTQEAGNLTLDSTAFCKAPDQMV
jgi:hypothetical protein